MYETYETTEESLRLHVHRAENKTVVNSLRNLLAILLAAALGNSELLYKSHFSFSLSQRNLSNPTGFACYYRGKGEREATRCSTTFRTFSESSPRIVFFRSTVSLSSLSSELSGAPLRQLYRRPRERFAVDNRNRLQTFHVTPAAISTFSARPYILFSPCTFPPATTNNTSVPTSVAPRQQQSCRQSYCPPGDPGTAPSSCPRSRDDYCTTAERTQRQPPSSPRKTSWFCGNLSSLPVVAYLLQRSFIPGFSSLFTISHYAPLGYAHKCARVKARICVWRTECAWTSYRDGLPSFLLFPFMVLCAVSLSLSLSLFVRQHIHTLRFFFFNVTFGFMSAATRS